MHRRIRQACTSLREQACKGAASIATVSGLTELDLHVARATSPEDLPLEEREVWRLAAALSTLNPSSSRAFVLAFTRRFGRTRSWRVALKCLLLLHRLLHVLPLSHPLHADLLSARENALISLYPCHFRDASSSSAADSYDFTVFIRSYASLLDQRLGCKPYVGNEAEALALPQESFPEKMDEVGELLELIPQLQNLLDRAMECEPVGAAARSFVVRPAVEQVVRESFSCYAAVKRGLPPMLDNLLRMPHASCIAGLAIYCRAAEQASRLTRFHQACKDMGLCGAYEYPLVEKIPLIQVRALESLISRMWQLTESSSSPSSSSVSSSSITSSSSPSIRLDENKAIGPVKKDVINVEWEKFAEIESEDKPLLHSEADETSWEALLEASIDQPCALQGFYDPWKWEQGDKHSKSKSDRGDWRMGVNDSQTANPFLDHVDAM